MCAHDSHPLTVRTVDSMVRTRVWRDGTVHDEDFDVESVSDWIAEEGTYVWVDFTDPTADDLRTIEDELGIHELASEDAVERGQRPKIDRYPDNMFLVAYDVTCPRPGEDVVTHEVKAFITERALVTMHGSDFDASQFVQRWDDNPELAQYGVRYLVWGILDVLVDHVSATIEQIEDLIGDLEEDLFSETGLGNTIQRRAFALRKALGTTRRLAVPLRSVLGPMLHDGGVLARALHEAAAAGRGNGAAAAPTSGDRPTSFGSSPFAQALRAEDARVPEGIRPYFGDVADHVTVIAESIDEQRDTLASILDTNLNLASNQQNLVMKKVTSWAAIIAIPTAITGFFGQNVKFPGYGEWAGLEASAGLIVISGALLYVVFKRRDWL
jgi:magnesium transporter